MKCPIIIDGTNILYRCFSIARKNPIENKYGERIETIELFLDSFFKIINEFEPDSIWIAWDTKNTPDSTNFRKDILKKVYKANRNKPDDFHEMIRQQSIIIEALTHFGVKHIYPNVLEADDCIGFLSQHLDKCIIITTDKDMYQLIDDNTSVYDFNKKILIDKKLFYEIEEMTPHNFLIYRAIMGDKSDNIIGIAGYGKIKAKRMVNNWKEQKTKLTQKDIQKIKINIGLMNLRKGFLFQKNEEKFLIEQYNYLSELDNLRRLNDIFTFLRECGVRPNKIKNWEYLLE